MRTPARERHSEVWVREKGMPRICRDRFPEKAPGRVLVVTDLTQASRAAEARAVTVATKAKARLTIAAVRPSSSGPTNALSLRAAVRLARWRGVQAGGTFVHGDPAEAIPQLAANMRADVIVMGHGAWCGPGRRGCSTCGHILLTAPCPVLITRAAEAA